MLKTLPPQFDASNLVEKQYMATSEDGTQVMASICLDRIDTSIFVIGPIRQIPYFLICDKDLVLDGTNPTILYGYGGFEISMTPAYSALMGSSWLNEKTHCYVMANIRGGGEFGPRWHQSALRENRHVFFSNFFDLLDLKSCFGRQEEGL